MQVKAAVKGKSFDEHSKKDAFLSFLSLKNLKDLLLQGSSVFSKC